MTAVNRTTVGIPTPSGFDIEAWFYQPEGQGPFPAVVMGHGLGAVKVGGLASFAERFCREGFAAVVIDYRQWGGSRGAAAARRTERATATRGLQHRDWVGRSPTEYRRRPSFRVGHIICRHARHRVGRL
jgi:dienelactone hydrolase